jgi:hypothetical protein
MSRIRANNFTDKAGTGAPTFPYGVNVTGVSTFGNVVVGGATTDVVINGDLRVTGIITTGTASITIDAENDSIRVGSATTIHTTGIDLGSGNITSHNIISTGIITASSFSGDGSALTGIDATSLKDSGGNVKVQANTSGAVVTGVLTATSFEGDGSSLTGIDATQIQTGNTSVQTVDTGSDGHVKVITEGTERFRIDNNGQQTKENIRVNDGTTSYVMMRGYQSLSIYVSDSGDDANDGSSSNPVRSLNQAWRMIPKLGWTGQAVNIRIMGSSYTTNSNTDVTGSFANGSRDIGPYITIQGDTQTVTVNMNHHINFAQCHGLRLVSLAFVIPTSGRSLNFTDCSSVRVYNNCSITSNSTAGWSAILGFNHCDSMYWEAPVTATSSSSNGLGGLITVYNSFVDWHAQVSKQGSRFGNHAFAVIYGSHLVGNVDVDNFARGISFGINHYNAETGARGMLNGSNITNCTTGIELYNHSYVRLYSVSWSGNGTNINVASNGGAVS